LTNIKVFLAHCVHGGVLYGCETLSLTLGEENRLRVFENRMLRKIFGPKSDKEIGGWKKLRNEEFRNLYCSPSELELSSQGG
jgi:hypothetical protein